MFLKKQPSSGPTNQSVHVLTEAKQIMYMKPEDDKAVCKWARYG